MLLMENFSPFAAAFKASPGFVQTLSCTETGEVEAQREGCKTGGEQIMRNRGELILLSSSPPAASAHRQNPGSKPYLPHLLAGCRSPTCSCKESLLLPRTDRSWIGTLDAFKSSASCTAYREDAQRDRWAKTIYSVIYFPPPHLPPSQETTESLTQPEQMQAAKITARPLCMPFCFFNTIKCLHTVWTLETLTALAETRAAAQAFNSFKWHHFLSWLCTRTISARCRHPPHRW